MRKSVFILLTVFMACLLCKESGNRPDAPWKFTNETFLTRGGGNLLADQWQCEYVYNSNLSLTGVLQECEKARTSVSMFQRGAQGRSRAAFLSMCCVTYGISGVAGLVARVHRKGFAAGLHAVDHYVYRLRRLHYLAMRQEDSQKAMHAVYSETIYTGHRRPGLFHSPS